MIRTPLQESKAQRQRAVAVFKNDQVGHIVMGHSLAWLHDNYEEAFLGLYGPESQGNQTNDIKEVHLQKWEGPVDSGRWATVKVMPVPKPVALPIAIRRTSPVLVPVPAA